MADIKVEADRKNGFVYIYIDDVNKGTIKLTIQDAYFLASRLLQELDRINPLLAESD